MNTPPARSGARLFSRQHIRDAGRTGGKAATWLWEFATNVVPAGLAIYLACSRLSLFTQVFVAVVFGLFAVSLFALLAIWQRIREEEGESTKEEARRAKRKTRPVNALSTDQIQPTLDRMSWLLMAAVLMLNAIDLVNHALQRNGIVHLTDREYGFSAVPGWTFTQLDIASLVAALVAILLPVYLNAYDRGTKLREKQLRRLFRFTLVPFAALAAVCACLLLCKLHGKDFASPDPERFAACVEKPAGAYIQPLAAMFAAGLRTGPVARSAPSANAAIARPDEEDAQAASGCIASPLVGWDAAWIAVGIVLFMLGYLSEHRTLFALFAPASRRNDENFVLWLRTLRALVFEAVVLPPIIVGAALVSGTLNAATAVVFGVFVYSGFSVWNIASKLIRDARRRFLGYLAVVAQFVYSALMTVLWALLFWCLEQNVCAPRSVFVPILWVAIAAILVQVVFGPVYRNAWGRSLSDRWTRVGPEYAVFATIVCLGVASMPNNHVWKWAVVVVSVLALIVVPATLVRRSLTAYVLIRIQPGKTAAVVKALNARDVSASVVYGEYDVLAKIEAAGTPLPFGQTDKDARDLYELAAMVKHVRQPNLGVLDTQTLLEFSDFLRAPNYDPGTTAESPGSTANGEPPRKSEKADAQTTMGGGSGRGNDHAGEH